ncbi:MAG: hypothetical protein JO243_05955 [Solirubrobacterales bacterium]|nr:hypothetical protein [Solirubrobacterales bacterium]
MPIAPLAVPICSAPDALPELLEEVVDEDDDDVAAAGAAAAVLVLEPLELPHPAAAMADTASAANAAARNFAVVQLPMMLLPERGFTGPANRAGYP